MDENTNYNIGKVIQQDKDKINNVVVVDNIKKKKKKKLNEIFEIKKKTY